MFSFLRGGNDVISWVYVIGSGNIPVLVLLGRRTPDGIQEFRGRFYRSPLEFGTVLGTYVFILLRGGNGVITCVLYHRYWELTGIDFAWEAYARWGTGVQHGVLPPSHLDIVLVLYWERILVRVILRRLHEHTAH